MPRPLFVLAALLAAALCVALPAAAQAPPDSLREGEYLREYELGEVVVGGEAAERPAAGTLQRIPLAELDRLDAASVAEAGRLIPAAFVQTNSRGETLLYLRGTGERQTALFFDGALLNVPWDNRIDLSLLPAGVVGSMTVAKGVPSVLWGPNVLGGAVNLVSRELEAAGDHVEATVQGGVPEAGQAGLLYLGRRGAFSVAAAASAAARTGFALPGDRDGAGLRFSQDHDAVRTNTDDRRLSAFARVSRAFGSAARLGVSVLVVDGEKGVAPESHLDPAEESVRYWRYPDWRTALAVLHGEAALGTASVRGALWANRFSQAISSFTDATYAVQSEQQDDEDVTFGGRAVVEQRLAPVTLRLALNGLVSTHRQQDAALEGGERVPDPALTYRQGLYSAGLEAEASPAEALRLTLGASLDALTTPETGDKPARDPLTDYGLTAGAAYRVAPGFVLHAAAGRKTRFPTLRELFGEALQRFALNPGLRPESALMAELGLRREGERLSGEAVLFLNRTSDTIDQERLPDGRRRRINLDGSRIVGVELSAALRPLARVRLDGHLTAMHARALREGEDIRLTERPEVLGRLAATYTAAGPTATAEAVYTGVAFSPSSDGFYRLPPSLVLNLRAGYRFTVPALGGAWVEVFARVNNVTDAVVLPQPGLPAPGREVLAGLKVAL